MAVSADPYELKLFQMFQSCDKERSGLLDEIALRRLCGLLELRDKGAKLITGLAAGGTKPHVSFDCFKEALLNFLGTELDGSSSTPAATPTSYTKTVQPLSAADDAACIRERSLIISDKVESYMDSPPESSDREVSPKLVMGSKKYGRRSRPHEFNDELSLSDSENGDYDEEEDGHRSCSAMNHNSSRMVQRSSSQTDIPGSRRRRPPATNGSKLKRCSSLPAQRNLQNQNKSALGNKSKAFTTNKSIGQNTTTLSSQLNKTQQPLSSSVESLGPPENLQETRLHDVLDFQLRRPTGNDLPRRRCDGLIFDFDVIYLPKWAQDTPMLMETLPAHSILDIWERANIANGRGILLALGFDEDDINLVQLNKVLEEELRSLEDEPQMTLLRASLALQSAELATLRQTFRQMHDENAKLRADNKDANRRVSMLAVEIDERHALLEDSSKKEVRSLEQRHSIVVRDLTARLTNDRENWTNLTSRLETRIKCFEQDEIRLKTDLDLIRRENSEYETEHQKLQKQITELLEKNIQLNREIADLEDSSRSEGLSGRSGEKLNEDDEVLRLVEKVSALQMENNDLRDKNDELVAEVENLNMELARSKAKIKKVTPSSAPTVLETDDVTLDESETGSGSSTATKRRGDSPSKARITEESPRLGKLRKCSSTHETDGGCSENNSDISGEWVALNSELQHSEGGASSANSECSKKVMSLKRKIAELEQELKAATELKSSDNENGTPPEERCKELEASLEQMQREYEECEDYWQSKLSDERQLFEKERQIYEDEQQESDKKFTELMEKVREYEEQFSKDGRLSPIEEKCTLEQQYADLEAEAEEIRENSRRIFTEKSLEIEGLQSEIEDLRIRLGESVEILTGASELNSEANAQRNSGPQSPASSPISYLWHQSTIQEPAKNYQSLVAATVGSPSKLANRNNLSTSETAIFSTTPVDGATGSVVSSQTVSPIQKPNGSKAMQSEGDVADCETSSTGSGKSFESQSIASTHSAQHQQRGGQMQNRNKTNLEVSPENSCSSPSGIKEELKRLKFFEISLKEQIKDLSLQRDGLVMELQQLQEARPVLEKAYARTSHPTLMQRVNQLELKNRHLQNVIKQQQHYTESLMQQSWRQHQMELSDLHNRIEAQGVMMAEQLQRLQNADILVKDLYVENSHLTATVQRLEQQRARTNLMHQQRQGLNGLPGMP